jgi:cleavage stimulation factor subunit 3
VQPTPQPQQNSIAPTPQPHTNKNAPPAYALPARLPHDKVGQLEDRIKDDPKGDVDAWLALIQHYVDKEQYSTARDVYTRFFEVFPTAVCLAHFQQAARSAFLPPPGRECGT